MRKITLLYITTFIRSLATGMLGVLLGLYLARLHLSPTELGFVISMGLVGATLATWLVTLQGDRFGRRRWLQLLALLSAGGGLGLAQATDFFWLSLAAGLGMLNGMGRDRGAALVLEQAMLPALVSDSQRTSTFAWYNVLQDVGHALGGLLAATPLLLRAWGVPEDASFRLAIILYALLMLMGFFLYQGLSEVSHPQTHLALSLQSRRVLTKISALFAIDSIAGGLVGSALLSFYFYQRFGVNEAQLGMLFMGARLANALSHLGAAWLAKRIGLVNTMVFTHIPSSFLLVTVAFAPNFEVAAILFLLREGLVEMDVPTRQSYVMAVVRPQERTFASGVTHLVRLGGWAVAPSLGGWLMQALAPATPLFIGAGMKITYDILLYGAFRKLKPPEEIS